VTTTSPRARADDVASTEVVDVLAEVVGGRDVDAADVPDTCWSRIAPLGLVSAEDVVRLPADTVDAFPMTRQQVSMASQMLLAAAQRRREAKPVPPYHNVAMSHLSVPAVDADAMRRAGHDMVVAHEMLRSTLDLDTYSCPMQVVHAGAEHDLVQVVDLRNLPKPEKQEQLKRFARDENARAIDLRRAPVVSFTVHLLSETRLTLTITEPHAIADGWSTHLNLVEFFERYTDAVSGTPHWSKEPSGAAHASALRQHSAQQLWQLRTTADESWWHDYLAAPEVGLPTAEIGEHTWQDRLELGPADVERLERAAAAAGVGSRVVLLAAHLRALATLSDTDTPTTGVTVNTRLAVEGGTDARGMFLNVVPVRSALRAPSSELLQAVHHDLMEVTIRGRVPLSHLARVLGRQIVPESLFVYNSFHGIKGAADRLGVDTFEHVDDWSHTDFSFEASFNRSEERSGRIVVLLFAQASTHARDRAIAAYRTAIDELAQIGER